MKTVLSITLSLALLSGVAQAQTCNSAIAESTPDIRFVVSDGEVTDLVTNLTWKRCAEGKVWNSTTSSCAGTALSLTWNLALAEPTGDWRVPNIKELLSIVEVSCGFPAINETIFPDTSNNFFWTSSPYINNDQAWSVLFEDGNDEGGNKNSGASVRLVRDAD